MTRAEAIEVLKGFVLYAEKVKSYTFLGDENIPIEALNMAIEALEQEPCDDRISRKEIIRWVKTECNPYGKPTLDFESGKKVIEHLEQMPSAEVGTQMSLADRPTGHWIDKGDFYVCSECGKRMAYAVLGPEFSRAYAFMSDYCPHCGSAMEVESDEE